MNQQKKMMVARLYGKGDIRIEKISKPPSPSKGQVLINVKAVGICGSDLHAYQQSSGGYPIILGHEYAGIVDEVGAECYDGFNRLLQKGTKVAIDPNQACGKCEMCEKGNPNLCVNLHFTGFYPDDGALQEWMIVPARCCFPADQKIDYASLALLEPLGVAIHAVDLSKIKVGQSVTILGAGPIGLCVLQVLRSMNMSPIFIVDQFDWRLKVAERFGGIPINFTRDDASKYILEWTKMRGTDLVFESAWADNAAQQAAEIAAGGGKLIMIGIPKNDQLSFRHSVLRRKGLTIMMVRRMKHSYPRAIQLLERGLVDLKSLVSHRFPLEKTAEAFALNATYKDQVVKVIIEI